MTHFLIAQVKVNDDSWIPEYATHVHEMVHRHNGKYLSSSDNITTIEGSASEANLVAIIEFPTMEDLNGLISDPEYAPFAKARREGTDSSLIAIDSVDAAGTIPYLDSNG